RAWGSTSRGHPTGALNRAPLTPRPRRGRQHPMHPPPRAARLAFFVYRDPIWSIGDRLDATFDFDSDEALRASLAPLGLSFLADEKLLEQRLRVLDAFEVDADVFGHLITLTVGPEDTYEHLADADYDAAEALEARFFAAGLERYKSPPRPLDDWT